MYFASLGIVTTLSVMVTAQMEPFGDCPVRNIGPIQNKNTNEYYPLLDGSSVAFKQLHERAGPLFIRFKFPSKIMQIFFIGWIYSLEECANDYETSCSRKKSQYLQKAFQKQADWQVVTVWRIHENITVGLNGEKIDSFEVPKGNGMRHDQWRVFTNALANTKDTKSIPYYQVQFDCLLANQLPHTTEKYPMETNFHRFDSMDGRESHEHVVTDPSHVYHAGESSARHSGERLPLVGIIVGVIISVLVLIGVVYLVIKLVKGRKTAQINETSQLQETKK